MQLGKYSTKYIINIITLCIALFIGCKKKTLETLFFPVGSDYDFIGLIKSNNNALFGFAKRNFNPNIKLFDINGVLMDSISLISVERKIGDVTDVWMYSEDSICVYSNYNGMLLIVNKKGEPILEKTYYTTTDQNAFHYDLLPSHSLYPFSTNHKQDVVFSTWMWSGESEQSPQERLDAVRNGFLLCKINPFQPENPTFGFRFSDIKEFSVVSNQSFFFMPTYKAFIVNNEFILASFYSRYLYKLSDSLSVEHSIKIIDDKSTIIKPIPMKNKGSIQDKANESVAMCQNAVFVANILFNNETQEYVVLLKTGESQLTDYSSFKILIYDKDFQKINEWNSPDSNYLPRKSFISSGKLYIEKRNDSHYTKLYENIEIF